MTAQQRSKWCSDFISDIVVSEIPTKAATRFWDTSLNPRSNIEWLRRVAERMVSLMSTSPP